MGNAVERYLRIYTAARLLRYAIERYREARQGPMLGRAGGSSRSLPWLVRAAGGGLRRAARPARAAPGRGAGHHRGHERRYPGQLYLALRLAALELHLDQSPPMPFIADDLFINWDDDRACAGLAALARLSRKTQVIFLTHHDHLVP